MASPRELGIKFKSGYKVFITTQVSFHRSKIGTVGSNVICVVRRLGWLLYLSSIDPALVSDVSQPSLGTDERDLGDTSDTPPASPKQDLRSNLKSSLESCWGDEHSMLPFARLKKPA